MFRPICEGSATVRRFAFCRPDSPLPVTICRSFFRRLREGVVGVGEALAAGVACFIIRGLGVDILAGRRPCVMKPFFTCST